MLRAEAGPPRAVRPEFPSEALELCSAAAWEQDGVCLGGCAGSWPEPKGHDEAKSHLSTIRPVPAVPAACPCRPELPAEHTAHGTTDCCTPRPCGSEGPFAAQTSAESGPAPAAAVRYSGNRHAQEGPRTLLQTVSSFAFMNHKQVEQ